MDLPWLQLTGKSCRLGVRLSEVFFFFLCCWLDGEDWTDGGEGFIFLLLWLPFFVVGVSVWFTLRG